jgi:hypothetical protein
MSPAWMQLHCLPIVLQQHSALLRSTVACNTADNLARQNLPPSLLGAALCVAYKDPDLILSFRPEKFSLARYSIDLMVCKTLASKI